jgi:hypothetical protein
MSIEGQNRPCSLETARPLPPNADIDLYLFAAAEASCVLARYRVDASGLHKLPWLGDADDEVHDARWLQDVVRSAAAVVSNRGGDVGVKQACAMRGSLQDQ